MARFLFLQVSSLDTRVEKSHIDKYRIHRTIYEWRHRAVFLIFLGVRQMVRSPMYCMRQMILWI